MQKVGSCLPLKIHRGEAAIDLVASERLRAGQTVLCTNSVGDSGKFQLLLC